MASGGERIIAGQVGLGKGGVIASPFQFATEGTDMLRVRLWCLAARGWLPPGPAFRVSVRSVRTNGEPQVTDRVVLPTTDLVVSTTLIPLDAGFLQTVSVTWAATGVTTLPGPTYAIVDLVRGTAPGAQLVVGQLLGGYVGAGQALSWPGAPIQGPMEGPGYQMTLGFAPGVGNDVVISAQSKEVWRVRSLELGFAAAAAGVNRWTTVFAKCPIATLCFCPAPQAVVPGSSANMSWIPGAPMAIGEPGFSGTAPWPDGLMLRFGDMIGTFTRALIPTDNYYEANLCFDMWIEPLP